MRKFTDRKVTLSFAFLYGEHRCFTLLILKKEEEKKPLYVHISAKR